LFRKISIKPINDFLDGGCHWRSRSIRLPHIRLCVWDRSVVLQRTVNLGVRCVTIPNAYFKRTINGIAWATEVFPPDRLEAAWTGGIVTIGSRDEGKGTIAPGPTTWKPQIGHTTFVTGP
jgi:hypothetical protein